MFAIYKKELHTYFTSPIGYILLAIFCAFSALFFVMQNLAGMNSDMTGTYQMIMVWIVTFYAPILTMRLMSEEKKLKTDQLLLTSPVTPAGIVIGKFLSAVTFFAISLAVTLLYILVACTYGNPIGAVLFGNLLGTLLFAGALISIGLFISALTESQMVSAFASFGVALLLMLLQNVTSGVTNPVLLQILSLFAVYDKLQQLQYGVFDVTAILYYLSVMAIFLFLTIRVIEKKRWS